MGRRPLSVSVVAWIILILSILSFLGLISMHTRITEHMELSGIPIHIYYLSIVTLVINFICAFCMLRGFNWSRLLYLCWGIIIFIYNFVVQPSSSWGPTFVSLVIFVIFNIFLFSSSANAYFGQGRAVDNDS